MRNVSRPSNSWIVQLAPVRKDPHHRDVPFAARQTTAVHIARIIMKVAVPAPQRSTMLGHSALADRVQLVLAHGLAHLPEAFSVGNFTRNQSGRFTRADY